MIWEISIIIVVKFMDGKHMKTVGIICEYNPFHLGHAGHLRRTRMALGGDCAIVCVMSGNFVQRGDVAVFGKPVRAKTAVLCGADLVLELPSPYALLSAEGFAKAGVYILDSLGVCDYLSFGSESGEIRALSEAAEAIITSQADTIIREWLAKGLPCAAAMQKAADVLLGTGSDAFKSPNNLLGIEYLKAIFAYGSQLIPITVKRTGGAHDDDTGFSASALSRILLRGGEPWEYIPIAVAFEYSEEIAAGRGPISIKRLESAVLSRLRFVKDFSRLPGATEGLDRRLARFATSEPTIAAILEKAKTKRYAMSRLRRMLMCACLGITSEDTRDPPPYVRALAMNSTGMKLLKQAQEKARLPIITKPASARKIMGRAAELFEKEAAATDFYVLAYQNEEARQSGQEWRRSPVVINNGQSVGDAHWASRNA